MTADPDLDPVSLCAEINALCRQELELTEQAESLSRQVRDLMRQAREVSWTAHRKSYGLGHHPRRILKIFRVYLHWYRAQYLQNFFNHKKPEPPPGTKPEPS